MNLTPFGAIVRNFRSTIGLSLKSMADALGVSSAHLSGIEFGEKTLLRKHVDATIDYFKARGASVEMIEQIEEAAGQSYESVKIDSFNSANRGFVTAFARRLEEGGELPQKLQDWIYKKVNNIE